MLVEPAIPQQLDEIEMARQFLIGYAPATRSAYEGDLGKWFSWCASVSLNPLNASRASVNAFAALLSDHRGLSRATVARHLAAISGFYQYAVDEGWIQANPVASVRRPKVGSDTPSTGFTYREVRELVYRAKADSPRSYALVSLLANTGMRISEALNANIEDLGTEREHYTLKITRKGGKSATIPLVPATWEAIQGYLGSRNEGPIFCAAGGGRFHRTDAWRLLTRLSGKGPHQIRHAFCTLTLDAGAAIQDVQDAMGHADPRTTQRYNRARNNLDNHPGQLLGLDA